MLPKLSIIGYVLYAALVFIIADLKVITALTVLLLAGMIFLPYRKLKTGVVPITLFLFVTFVMNLFFSPGKIAISFGPVTITEEGFSLALLRTMRVFLLIAGAKFLTIASSLDDVIAAMGQLLSPLEKARVPVKGFFTTMSLSIRVLPVIKERIADEYTSRMGTDKGTGLRDKASVVFRFILPVFFESISNPESFLKKDKVRYPEGGEAGQR